MLPAASHDCCRTLVPCSHSSLGDVFLGNNLKHFEIQVWCCRLCCPQRELELLSLDVLKNREGYVPVPMPWKELVARWVFFYVVDISPMNYLVLSFRLTTIGARPRDFRDSSPPTPSAKLRSGERSGGEALRGPGAEIHVSSVGSTARSLNTMRCQSFLWISFAVLC